VHVGVGLSFEYGSRRDGLFATHPQLDLIRREGSTILQSHLVTAEGECSPEAA
jgi:hypothetical protein